MHPYAAKKDAESKKLTQRKPCRHAQHKIPLLLPLSA